MFGILKIRMMQHKGSRTVGKYTIGIDFDMLSGTEMLVEWIQELEEVMVCAGMRQITGNSADLEEQSGCRIPNVRLTVRT